MAKGPLGILDIDDVLSIARDGAGKVVGKTVGETVKQVITTLVEDRIAAGGILEKVLKS